MIETQETVGIERIQKIFETQRKNQYKVAETSAKERIRKLQKLSDTVLKYRPEIREALWKDYRRPAAEADLAEIYPITSEIKHTQRRLRSWMARQRVETPLSLVGSRSWIQYEPKGVCLIIGPWNYPIQLVVGPLVSAVAAGNTVIVKPSENTPHSAAILRQIVSEVFNENEVVVVEGAVETSTALLKLPFNHIFFTGAPEIGKIVMAAAAKTLASVTLELGGKSPVIVDETADLSVASKRIAWGKFTNNGQVCVAPDYVFVHASKTKAFIEAMTSRIKEFYGDNAATSESYMRIVNSRHFNRVKTYLEDSVNAGATVVYGGKHNEGDNFIEPTIVMDVPLDSALMQEEIFGPVMPVIPYNDLQEVVDLIRLKEKPLALYIYSKNKKNINHILQSTRAGGTCINNNTVHFSHPNLPFGGSNNSGIGKTHGKFGFITFSNERAVYKQVLPTLLDKLFPPYTSVKMKLINLVIKWF